MLFYFYFHLLLQDICLSENKNDFWNKNTEKKYMLIEIKSGFARLQDERIPTAPQAWGTAFLFDEKLWKLSLLVL